MPDLRPTKLGTAILARANGTKSHYPTIQEAVDAAATGDIVLLSGYFRGPGNSDVLVANKDLQIRGVGGASACLIDCEFAHRGFVFCGDQVTNKTILSGVAITNGNPPLTSFFGSGGAILVQDSYPTIEYCSIFNNTARVGGGIATGTTTGAPPNGRVVIRHCLIRGNCAPTSAAGGILTFYATIRQCTIVGNTADTRGGGIRCSQTGIYDSVIAQNRTGLAGAGIYVADTGSIISNCTIADNSTTQGPGGGVHAYISDVACQNTILWENTATAGPQFYSENFVFAAQPTIDYSVIEGGASGVGQDNSLGMPILTAILTSDPLFSNKNQGDYHIAPQSPCIDAGQPFFRPTTNEGDIDNHPRTNGTVDIGADEHFDGLVLSLPSPGRPGQVNRISACGATPGDIVVFFFGLAPGYANLSFGSCPNLALAIETPLLAGLVFADNRGVATYSGFLSPFTTGQDLFLQAVTITPPAPLSCAVSNLVTFVIP